MNLVLNAASSSKNAEHQDKASVIFERKCINMENSYDSDLSHKSSSLRSEKCIEDLNTDSRSQNIAVPNLSNSLKTHNPEENICNTNPSLKTRKRDQISDNDYKYEPGNKLIKFSNSLEPGIVYAIKQVKGVNQASPIDYNIFKFPEVFFSMKKNLRPKTSLSCSRIQLTKAVREAIRKSHSFNYTPKEWSPEFSENNTSHKYRNSIKLHKDLIKTSLKSSSPGRKSTILPDVQCSPQAFGTWESRINTVAETVHVYPEINTENSPLEKTDISVNKDSCFKRSFSFATTSPDTRNYLSSSLGFDDEINSSRIIISQVHEESIVKSTTVFTATIEDAFANGSNFCLDSSISLVPNDDTYSNISLKLSTNALNSTNCLNPTFDDLTNIPLQDIDTLKSSNDIMKNVPVNSPRLLLQDAFQEQISERNSKYSEKALSSILTPQNNKKNQDYLTDFTLSKKDNINNESGIIISNKEIENDICELTAKASCTPSSKTDFKNCCSELKQKQVKKCIKSQMKKSDDSPDKHGQVVPNGSIETLLKVNKPTEKQFLQVQETLLSNQNCYTGLEKSAQDNSHQQCDLNKTLNKDINNKNLQSEDSSATQISSCNPTMQINQVLNSSNNATKCFVNSRTTSCIPDNAETEKSSEPVLDENEKNDKLLLLFPSNSVNETVESPISSRSNKSQAKLNKNKMTAISSTVNTKEICSNVVSEVEIVDTNSGNNDMIDEVNLIQGNLDQNNKNLKNPFEKIHSLRKQFIDASKSENCLWSLRTLDNKGALFEILGESVFAGYLMSVDLEFKAEITMCTQIIFMHLKEEPDDREELGLSFFCFLTESYVKDFPFPAHELLNKLPIFVDFALSAKSLIKDVWFAAVRNDISIDVSIQTPTLNIKILNENHFSYFNVKLPISFASYPNEEILPEITHLEHNIIEKEVIIGAIKKIHPGEKYLFRISKAVHDL